MKQSLRTFLTSLAAGILGSAAFYFLAPGKEVFLRNASLSDAPAKFANFNPLSPSLNENFVGASAISTPSVVYIKTLTGANNSAFDPFDWFFGGGNRIIGGSGSGVIYSKDGYIITNNHVIAGAEKIEVIRGSRSYAAKVVGTDPSTDLAVLKIEANNLPSITFGNSRKLQVGEWVLAVGNPFNLTSTVTAGIVSAKGRNINILNSQFPIESFIQTDAAINPGNSGGALVDMEGKLVGINTAILSRTGSYTGYGFAVPSDIVAKVVKDLIEYGEVQKVFVGLEVTDPDEQTVSKWDSDDFMGVVVNYVEPGGAAESAGIRKGDVVTVIDGEKILGKSSFDEQLAYKRPGDRITMRYQRGSSEREVVLKLTNREGTTDVVKRSIFSSQRMGASFENLSKVERNRFKIDEGVRVAEVSGGVFGRLGVQEGFIILRINGKNVKTASEIVKILDDLKGRVVLEGVDLNGMSGYYSFYL